MNRKVNSVISGNLQEHNPPPVIFWFKVYTGVMTTIYGLFVLAGPVLFWIGTETQTKEEGELIIQGVWLFIIGLPLAIAYGLPFFLPRKSWVWVYDLVLICLGLGSCCFLPATVPLLIYWIKPETKAWFNRADL